MKPVRSWMAAEGDADAVRIAASAISDRSDAHAEAARILDAGGEALFQELVPGDREAVSFVRAERPLLGRVRAARGAHASRHRGQFGGAGKHRAARRRRFRRTEARVGARARRLRGGGVPTRPRRAARAHGDQPAALGVGRDRGAVRHRLPRADRASGPGKIWVPRFRDTEWVRGCAGWAETSPACEK